MGVIIKKALNLLIADESPGDALLLVDFLRMKGYQPEYKRVDTLDDMRAAMRKKNFWDAILYDYSMPFTVDALKIMQQGTQDIPFLIISDPIGEEAVVAVMRAGAHGYVPKSNLQRLAVVLEREIQEAAERKTLKKTVRGAERKERWKEDLEDCLANKITIELENEVLAQEVQVSFDSIIQSFSCTIEDRDLFLSMHSQRVAEYSLLLGEEMQLTLLEMETLKYAAILHDVGKIAIRDNVLKSTNKLTEKEFAHIQTHAAYTYHILKSIHFEPHMRMIPEIAAAHHERMDGTGYHLGLRGMEIPYLSRILAVADVFDAITSQRRYRERMTFGRAVSTLKKESGTHFDADCVAGFMQIKLYGLCRVLLRQHKEQYDESDQRLLRKLDKNITITEYRNIHAKSNQSHGEAEVSRIFNSIYGGRRNYI